MGKILIKRAYALMVIVSYTSASVLSNKWVLDQDFENNLDTSQLLWDKDGISLLTCGSLCNPNPSCRSYFYHPSFKKCLGSQSYKRGLPFGQSVQQGWKYYTKPQKCDGNYTLNNTLCYKIHPETKLFLDAMDACEAEGAKLIIIINQMEFEQVRDALKAAGPLTYPFVGLRKTSSNGTIMWKWWNGKIPFDMDYEPGQPDNWGGSEDCGNFYTVSGSQYKFDDVSCLWYNSFICQKYI